MGRSRGGLTTKLHLLTDGSGRPIKLKLTGGQTADCKQAIPLLAGQKADAVLADKGYDSDAIICFVRYCMKAKVVIPPKKNRTVKRCYNKELYKERNLIERAFGRLKQWRRVATRYDRIDTHFLSCIALAAIAIWG